MPGRASYFCSISGSSVVMRPHLPGSWRGVQVLFGFLLSLPFTNRFARLDGAQRDLYLTCLVLSAVATTVLLGPVAYHRLVFRRGMKEGLVRFANLMAIIGLCCIGAA